MKTDANQTKQISDWQNKLTRTQTHHHDIDFMCATLQRCRLKATRVCREASLSRCSSELSAVLPPAVFRKKPCSKLSFDRVGVLPQHAVTGLGRMRVSCPGCRMERAGLWMYCLGASAWDVLGIPWLVHAFARWYCQSVEVFVRRSLFVCVVAEATL